MFQLSVSVPLVLEYESAAKGISNLVGLRHSDIDDILDYIRRVAEHRDICYLWRPFLRDPIKKILRHLVKVGRPPPELE